jgi:hypothetical protein
MLPGILFTFWRISELVTLIPVIGMLSYFVNVFTKANLLTPAYVLALFIVSVLAAFWALSTLLAYHLTKWNAHFCALVDLLFVGALIAGVYYLRGITSYDCVSSPTTLYATNGIDLGFAQVSGGLSIPNFNKTCAMLKASFAFGIMNIFFFFITFVRPLDSGPFPNANVRQLILLWVAREHVDYHHSRHYRRDSRSYRSRSPRTSHRSSSRRHSRTYV